VTSFSCFKYMALYSAIQFTSVSILYRWGCNLGDFQVRLVLFYGALMGKFLLIDLFLILPVAVFMGWASPYAKLSPRPPPSNLVSKSVITSLIGHIIIFALVQLFLIYLVTDMSWYAQSPALLIGRYIPPIVDPENPEIRNSDNTVLFLMSCYQYIMIAIILSVGPPYRQPMVQNCIPLENYPNGSSIYGDHRYGSTVHNDNNLSSTSIRGVGTTIDLCEHIIRVPFNCDCGGELYRELVRREDYLCASSKCFG
jgi:magnesium-transporting ATPase (P-type)